MESIVLGRTKGCMDKKPKRGALIESFLLSRYGKTNIKDAGLIEKNIPTINFLEIVENYDTGLSFFKHGMDIDSLNNGKKLFMESYKGDKKILIITDYDCDGINSAVVAAKLRDLYFNKDKIDIIVNKRKYGNGVNKNNFQGLNLEDYSLIITADHGSSNNNIFLYLKDEYENIKIVVTDHHMIPEENPPINADVLINNMKSEELSKNFSGCYTLWFYLFYILNKEFKYKAIDILYPVVENIAFSIISDVMDVSEPVNRTIFKLALKKINSGKCLFIENMREVLPLPYNITLEDFRFNICPAINSGNRLHEEELAFNALYKSNKEDIKNLMNLNERRKRITKDVLNALEERKSIYLNSVAICTVKTEYGINGIIAGKIGEMYKRPSICFQKGEDGILHGSCRSIVPGFNMLEIIKELNKRGLVAKYGGHKQAVGCTVRESEYSEFITECELLVKNQLGSLDVKDEILVDGILHPEEVSFLDILNLDFFTPYGNGFEDPTFYTEIYVDDSFTTETIARVTYNLNNRALIFLAFNNIKVPLRETFKRGNKVGIVFKPSFSFYRGELNMKLIITRAVVL